jgi:hypothetical protein
MICRREGCGQEVPPYQHSRCCGPVCAWLDNGFAHTLVRIRRAQARNDMAALRQLNAEWLALAEVGCALDQYRELRT